MNNQEIKDELPPNYEELKRSANRNSNWRERLEAVEALGQWNHKKVIDVLTHRATFDAVYVVREAAVHKLKQFGEDIQLLPRQKGELIHGVNKVLVRIKKSLPRDHSFEEFKEKLKKMRTDIYDTYEGEKGTEFDEWLESTWASMLKKKDI